MAEAPTPIPLGMVGGGEGAFIGAVLGVAAVGTFLHTLGTSVDSPARR